MQNFPSIENEVKFASFASFKKEYFTPFLITFQKLAVDRKVATDDKDMKDKGKRMNGAVSKWIKAHWDELQFYTVESYYVDGSEVDEKFKDLSFAANVAIVRYEGSTPYFYFIKARGERDEAMEVRPATPHPTPPPLLVPCRTRTSRGSCKAACDSGVGVGQQTG